MDQEPSDISGDDQQDRVATAPHIKADAKRQASGSPRSSNPFEGAAQALGQGIQSAGNALGQAKDEAGRDLSAVGSSLQSMPKAEANARLLQSNPAQFLWDASGLNPQKSWEGVQYFGRVMHAFYDPEAIGKSIHAINHDNSMGGQVKRTITQALLGPAYFDPNKSGSLQGGAEWFDENVPGEAITMLGTLPSAMWIPMASTEYSGNLSDIPGEKAKSFVEDAKGLAKTGGEAAGLEEEIRRNPGKLAEAETWRSLGHLQIEIYQRAGHALLSGIILSGMVTPFGKFIRRMPGAERLADHIVQFAFPESRLKKNPIVMDSGHTIDPVKNPNEGERYSWIKSVSEDMSPIEEGRKKISSAAEDLDISERRVGRVAKKLGLTGESAEERAASFSANVARGIYNSSHVAWIKKNWRDVQKTLGFQMPLEHWHPAEPALGNPFDHLDMMDKRLQVQATRLLSAGNRLIGHTGAGVFGHHEDPMASLMRSMAAGGRLTKRISDDYLKELSGLLSKGEMDEVGAAIEDLSGEKAKALSPAQMMAYDLGRQVYGVIGDRSVEFGRFSDRIPGYLPRYFDKPAVPLEEKISQGAAVKKMLGKPTHGRAESLSIDEQGNYITEQRYKTIADANKVFAERREELTKAILEDHPQMDPKAAERIAREHMPNFSTDYYKILERDLARSIEDTHTHQVLDILSHAHTKVGDLRLPAAYRLGVDHAHNQALDPTLKRLPPAEQIRHLTDRGWTKLEGVRGDYLVHPGFAEPWNRFIKATSRDRNAALRLARTLTRWGMTAIMFDPLWHAMNMMGRATDLFFAHPYTTFKSLTENHIGRKLEDGEARELWDQAKDRFVAHGGILHAGRHGDPMGEMLANWSRQTGDAEVGSALGESVMQPHGPFASNPALAKAVGYVGAPSRAYGHINDWFRARYDDFGVLAFMAEEKHALSRGLDPVQAAFLGASRGNAWKGAVAPEQWARNPFMHEASQLLMFAPNWWRSWIQLSAGKYYGAGLAPNREMAKYWAVNQAKTMFGMWASNFFIGNGLNYLTSGHLQMQNDPGNKNSIELDRFNGGARDPQTGAKKVLENPFDRQQKDTWALFGLTAPPEDYLLGKFIGAPDPTPANPSETAMTLLARQGILPQLLSTAANLDAYGSIKAREWRWIDPDHPGLRVTGKSMLAALAALTPFSYGAERAVAPPSYGKPQAPPDGSPGSQAPQWAKDTFGFGTQDKDAQFAGAVLGVRGPYQAPAEKTEGEGLSSTRQQEVDAYLKNYDDGLLASETQVAKGQMTPNAWLANYEKASAAKAGYLQGQYDGVGDYKDGAAGVMSRWEGLYGYAGPDGKVVLDDGSINHVLLARKQAELENEVKSKQGGQAVWDHFQANLRQEEMKHPLLKAWKDVQAQYRSFQDDYARGHGMTGAQLQDALQAWYSAGTKRDRDLYERNHPEIREFVRQKRNWERTTGAGFMYGMFTNSTYVADLVDHLGKQGQQQYVEKVIASEKADIDKQKAASGG